MWQQPFLHSRPDETDPEEPRASAEAAPTDGSAAPETSEAEPVVESAGDDDPRVGSGAGADPEASDAFELFLSLDDAAVAWAVENNLNIRVARLDDAIVQRQVVVARSAFDPFFNVNATYAKNRDPTVSFLDVGAGVQGVTVNPSEVVSYSANVTGTWVYGTAYTLQLQQNEFDRPAAAAGGITRLNPITPTQAFADLRQPLLRGAWYAVNTADVRIALNNLKWSRETLELQSGHDDHGGRDGVLVARLYATRMSIARRRALELALELLENDRLRRQAGAISDNEVMTSESQWVLRKVDLRAAELERANALDALLDLVNFSGDRSMRELWRMGHADRYRPERIDCTTLPDEGLLAVAEDEALELAFQHRADYKQLGINLENQKIRVEGGAQRPAAESRSTRTMDSAWPRGDLTEDSYSSVGSGRFYDWLVGVEVLRAALASAGRGAHSATPARSTVS